MTEEMTFQVKVEPPSGGRLLPNVEVYLLTGGVLVHSHLVLPAPPNELFAHFSPYSEHLTAYEQQLKGLGIPQPSARFEEVSGLAGVEEFLRELMRPPVDNLLVDDQLNGLIATMMRTIEGNLDAGGDAPGQYL